MFLDDVTNDIIVSQFGMEKKRDEFDLIPSSAESALTRIPKSSIKSMISEGAMSGKYEPRDEWVSSGMQWPNKLSRTPAEVGDFIVVPDGFLPPGKEDGNIFFVDANGVLCRITANEKGAFYHEVEWFDFND